MRKIGGFFILAALTAGSKIATSQVVQLIECRDPSKTIRACENELSSIAHIVPLTPITPQDPWKETIGLWAELRATVGKLTTTLPYEIESYINSGDELLRNKVIFITEPANVAQFRQLQTLVKNGYLQQLSVMRDKRQKGLLTKVISILTEIDRSMAKNLPTVSIKDLKNSDH